MVIIYHQHNFTDEEQTETLALKYSIRLYHDFKKPLFEQELDEEFQYGTSSER